MPATLTTLGAVHSNPQNHTLTLAGKERILIRNEFKEVIFYHTFEINEELEKLHPVAGESLFIRSAVYPVMGEAGKVILRPLAAKRMNTSSEYFDTDAKNGYVLRDGINQMHAEGIVAIQPRRVKLDVDTMAMNASLIVENGFGLLEIVSYGCTAEGLSGINRGNRVWLQGRMISERRPLGSGGYRMYSRLETYRQSSIKSSR